MKTSELLIKAKAILVTGLADPKRHYTHSISNLADMYLCHAIEKADETYWPMGGCILPKSPECVRALHAVGVFTKNSQGFGNVYDNFIENLHGRLAFSNATYDDRQAGRHRLLDFLIVEFQTFGD